MNGGDLLVEKSKEKGTEKMHLRFYRFLKEGVATSLTGIVIAALAIGCSREDALDQESSAESSSESTAIVTKSRALNTAPVIGDFAVYAKNSIKVGDRAQVIGKDVGVQ